MGITRRDFLKVLGVSTLPLLNFKNIINDNKELEFKIITAKPVESLVLLLNQLKNSGEKNISLYGVNGEALNILKYVLNRTKSGIYKGGSNSLWNSSLMAVLEVKRVAYTKPGFTMLSDNRILDPRTGAFSNIAGKIYSEDKADYEITLKISSIADKTVKKPGTKAKILINGRTKGFINLSKNEKLSFSTNLGKIKIVSESGKVRVEESSCKHKICMHRGAISNGGEKLICAPQKVIVEVVGKSIVDSIVG